MILGRLNSKIFSSIIILFLFGDFAFAQSSKNQSKIATIADITVPEGYSRIITDKNSFANWIRKLPLKPAGSNVRDFRGNIFKSTDDSTVAFVINWPIAGKRLEQCMDILVRFYAEYLWNMQEQVKLSLPLPGRHLLKWTDWQLGYRPKFKGINFELIKSTKFNSSKNNYNQYLNLIFAETHTQQFYYAYPEINRHEVRIGDFIVKKGVKGHAVLIVDLAKNANGNLIALIGQGDTPACEFYLLNYKTKNPWFPLRFDKEALPLPIRKKMTWDGLRRFE
jgi:hypothetical protein